MFECYIKNDKINIINNLKNYNVNFKLREYQKKAIDKIDRNFMENFLFVAPTAYGKTIVAVYYLIKVIKSGLKVIYTAPLKALTWEIKNKLNDIGIDVLEDTGDNRKKPDKDYEKADIIITTYERLDSIMRNQKYHPILQNFGLLIVDEVHTIHSEGRGINLESLLTKIMTHTPMSIMGMSATIDNYKTVADFLDCEYIYVPPEERPVKQNIYIKYYEYYYNSQAIKERNVILRNIVNRLIRINKQALIFCSSRKRCEYLAKKFSGYSDRDPIRLAQKSNYTYHHAGLNSVQKKKVENLFLANKCKFIFCTPTLAMGVNLPAYCVIIYDTFRWNGLMSKNVLIDSMEIEQMVGRAGRPQYGEKECEIYIFSRKEDYPYKIRDSIVISKLDTDLKDVINEWICSGINHKLSIKDAIYSTLCSVQVDKKTLKKKAQDALNWLINNGFVNYMNNDEFTSSFLGKMTSLFYIKPKTSLHFKEIESEFTKRDFSDLELVSELINVEEFLDLIRVEDRDKKVVDLCSREFDKQNIPNKLWKEKIMKVIPMIFTKHFENKYNTQIKVYRNDSVALVSMMRRLFSSAKVIVYNDKMKQRINGLEVMVKTRSLNREIAILKRVKGLGDVRINRLIKANIKSADQFLKTSDNNLKNIMRVSDKVLLKIKSNLKQTLINT